MGLQRHCLSAARVKRRPKRNGDGGMQVSAFETTKEAGRAAAGMEKEDETQEDAQRRGRA